MLKDLKTNIVFDKGVNHKYLFWFDLEMTGLNINTCHILEIACIVTDINLNIIDKSSNIVIYQTQNILSTMNNFCKKIHNDSGLIKDVKKSVISLQKAETLIIDFISPYLTNKLAIMCGNSIWQDRKFIDKYMSKLSSFFHYRILDVSSFKISCFLWNNEILFKVKKNNIHRAINDIIESIEEMKIYYMYLFKNNK